ncbi:hypothetical protein GCM10009716_48840 [Streptomyces sodiiphilus]|uniref:Uncharacterized protein n=1 Tax=Streptomyces sodiiphilus TaxID=226217 RepID=A0ABN2PWT4_9ACTN
MAKGGKPDAAPRCTPHDRPGSPPLTTLAGPSGETGRTAVDMLLGLRGQDGSRPQRGEVVLPSHPAPGPAVRLW